VNEGQMVLVAGALLAAGLLASLVAGRLRVPGLLLFLGVGMLAGSDGFGWIDFSDYELARVVGIIALALILFEGGLASGWHEIRPVFVPAFSLATVGTLVTAAIVGLGAGLLFDLSTLEGLLLGAIVSSTDGAAIFAVLRGSTLRRRLARTLEGEAGMNDPVAVLLVLGFIEWIQDPEYDAVDMIAAIGQELAIGGAVGLAVGWLAVRILRDVRLASAGLYPVASLAFAALAFGGADVLHGSGFLAVYLTGLVLGTSATPARRTITTFHEGVAWVAQLGMFLVLGLLVFPSDLGEVWLEGIVLALVLVFVARPVATFVATPGMGFTFPEGVALGWAGLRGAVPVVLATFPVIAGLEGSLKFFDIVFFAVLVSTLLQGTTFEWVGARLGVTTNEAAIPTPFTEPATARRLGAEIAEFRISDGDAAAGRLVRELGLPRDALLNLIVRGEQAIPPRGSTRVEVGDRLHVLVRQEVAIEFQDLLRRWREGPVGPRPVSRPLPHSKIITSRPWDERDGDPSRPTAVDGIEVVEQLRTRRDRPGALVALADGRYAFTGPVVAVGPSQPLQELARRRLGRADDDAERSWWREVIGALALP
jgi:cell volume regulation protein A